MKKIPFSVTMQLLTLLKKMNFNFNLEFGNTKEQLGATIIQEIILKIPSVQEEFIELLNKIAETDYTIESDTFEIVSTLKVEYLGIAQAFSQALKLKNSIS
jgi:hypothetical protein